MIRVLFDKSVWEYNDAKTGEPHYRAELIADTAAEILNSVNTVRGIVPTMGSKAFALDNDTSYILGSDGIWKESTKIYM